MLPSRSPRPPAPTGAALAVAILAVAACDRGGTAAEPMPWTERDSAGVVVVDNDPARVPLDGWSVDPVPLLAVGGLDAAESHQLYQVEGATRLPDGRVAVASAGTFDVRIYDASGALVARHGAEGDGPGEFRDLALMGRYGADTLVVFDATSSRLTWIHPDRGIVGSTPVVWGGLGFPVGRGLLADGSILVGGGMTFSSSEGFPTGVIRPPSTFGWVGRDGTEARRLGDYPASEMFARANEQGFMARGLPFGRATRAAPALAGVWLAPGDGDEIRLFGMDGALERVVRTSAPRRGVTAADRAAYVDDEVSSTSSDNEARQLRALLEEMPFPETFPPFQALVTDSEGNLWVQEYPTPGQTDPAWTVFDAGGHVTARLGTPPRTRILEIGADYVLGRTLDDLDVEILTLWRLNRP
jgi:hypothetical protein